MLQSIIDRLLEKLIPKSREGNDKPKWTWRSIYDFYIYLLDVGLCSCAQFFVSLRHSPTFPPRGLCGTESKSQSRNHPCHRRSDRTSPSPTGALTRHFRERCHCPMMHPIHRLAHSSAPSSLFQSASHFVQNHPFWTSRLFFRVSVLCGLLLFSIFWFAPTLPYRFSLDTEWRPPPGMPPLMDDDPLPPPVSHPIQPDTPPPVYEKLPPQVWDNRAQKVKDSFLFAWHGYDAAAFGYDELLPVTNGSTQNFNGWGVTIVDSLSTMLLMGLKDSEEYKHAMEHVAQMHFKDHVRP